MLAFLEALRQEAIGYDAAFLAEIEEGIAILDGQGVTGPIPARQAIAVAQRAKEAVPLAEQTIGKGAPGPGRGKKTDDNISRLSDYGTSADYLTRRIARDRPDILARMQAGEYRSVRQAAIAAHASSTAPPPLDPPDRRGDGSGSECRREMAERWLFN